MLHQVSRAIGIEANQNTQIATKTYDRESIVTHGIRSLILNCDDSDAQTGNCLV